MLYLRFRIHSRTKLRSGEFCPQLFFHTLGKSGAPIRAALLDIVEEIKPAHRKGGLVTGKHQDSGRLFEERRRVPHSALAVVFTINCQGFLLLLARHANARVL